MDEPTERQVTFEWNGLRLAGSLHFPGSKGPHPAVLMMQGSGPSDRNADGYFPPIREAFLRPGIATFAFDKPGCGGSAGDWRDYGLAERADQAMRALDSIRSEPGIDPERFGVWGQSQGGWLVQILAGRLPDLAFAIANSGPTINLPEQDLYGCEHTMRSQGHTEDEVSRAVAFIDSLHDAARRGLDFATVDAQILRDAREQPWYGYFPADIDAADWALTKKFVTERYEPKESLATVRCPFLAIYGGHDVLLPAWQCAEETGRSLPPDNGDASVVVFSQGDHRIRDIETGEFVPGYLDLLGDWASRRV